MHSSSTRFIFHIVLPPIVSTQIHLDMWPTTSQKISHSETRRHDQISNPDFPNFKST
jgi:hypothetical protein